MIVYRINNIKYKDDISGTGAFINGGRWNNIETYMLYTATFRSLALLESLVHLKNVNQSSWHMLSLQLPIKENELEKIALNLLPKNWVNNESETRYFGELFINANKNLGLLVPSAIVHEEYNLILNPKHVLFSKIKVVENKLINIDKRLF
jgi:RES domain-containing protein